ncbi:MAG: twin-arginine translocase TatA/TatE family subunit [Planctomycetota bacterium]|jgi:sec-independent protein translocase protein TatA|nr:twin-arginine translocase TatA/TatE family subunit [Planctomycetota bacterium]
MSVSGALAIFGMPGGIEWVIILVVALLLFGRRLPEVMRGLGGGMREFRKGIDGSEEEVKRVVPDDKKPLPDTKLDTKADTKAETQAAPAADGDAKSS